MLLRALKEYHYALYQTFLAFVGLAATLFLLGEYRWTAAMGYAALTLLAYWGGQGIVELIQQSRRRRARGSRPVD